MRRQKIQFCPIRVKTAAFSLIELMIVITIIAALATAAIPSYIQYLKRAAITEAVSVLGEYRTSLGVFWNTQSRLPTTGDTLTGPSVNLPFGVLVTNPNLLANTASGISATTTNTNTNIPETVQTIELTASGNGVLITLVIQSDVFSTVTTNNRTIVLGALIQNNSIIFQCGNFTTNASAISDIGFTDITTLPSSCNYNGVGTWLNTSPGPTTP